jgi:hypothetical protein
MRLPKAKTMAGREATIVKVGPKVGHRKMAGTGATDTVPSSIDFTTGIMAPSKWTGNGHLPHVQRPVEDHRCRTTPIPAPTKIIPSRIA